MLARTMFSAFCGMILLSSFETVRGSELVFERHRPVLDTVPAFDTSATTRFYTKVDKDAEFPGGEPAWKKFLEKNINGNIAAENDAPAGKYTVIVQFVVSKEGTIKSIQAQTNMGYGMEAELIRVIQMSAQWTPAMLDGKPLNAYRQQPITFVVTVGKKKKSK